MGYHLAIMLGDVSSIDIMHYSEIIAALHEIYLAHMIEQIK